ncbi:hypothetical protein [Lactovum odontotermitis]
MDIQYKRGKWSEEENAQLRKLAIKHTDQKISEQIHRKPAAILRQRLILGIKKREHPFAQKSWSLKEQTQLKVLLKTHTESGTAEIMHRTEGSIRGKKDLLGLKAARTWQEKDYAQLKGLVAQNKSNSEIAEIMGRTRRAIQQAKYKLDLGDFSIRKWTKQEETELRELSTEKTIAELAQHFGRGWTAIERKCQALGIKTQSKHIVILGPFTPEEDDYIIKTSWYMTNLQLSEKLNRTEGSVKQRKTRLRKMGFTVGTCLPQKGQNE